MSDPTRTIEAPAIPDHLLVRCIGSGSYGDVWLARNEATQCYRAVKIVRRDRFVDERPFQREFEGIQKFEPVSRNHPNLIDILHVGKCDRGGYFYYVMELGDDLFVGQKIEPEKYKARTLKSQVDHFGRPPLAHSLRVAEGLAEGLAYLHSENLLHRDIKPSNIIFVNDVPKFADIGLVAAIGEARTTVGTPLFIPPEGFRGPASDIYSLGKLLYVLFLQDSLEPFPDLPEDWRALGDETLVLQLHQIISQACKSEPRQRYQSALELREALHEVSERLTPTPPARLPSILVHVPINSAPPPRQAAAPGGSPAPASPAPAKRSGISILCKSTAEPDAHVLRCLTMELTRRGFEVWSDEDRTNVSAWAKTLHRRILGSEVVIVLLSEASVQSDLFVQEVELAHHAALEQGGRPHLVAVRLDPEVQLPPALVGFLNLVPLHDWSGPADDSRLATELAEAINRPASLGGNGRPISVEPAGGAVPLESGYYVVRPTDLEFQTALARRDSIVLVKGARQMGKTSLLARGLRQAREQGAKVVFSDFQKLNARQLESVSAFLLALAENLADQLDLTALPEDLWNVRRSPNSNFERFLRREVLGSFAGHLVWGLDEVDRLFSCSFGSEVFGLFRSWHNERALDPHGPWSRLTLTMAYATEAHLFITDINQSPFNVGTRLALDDFTLDQVKDLNQRHGSPLKSPEELRDFYDLLGGQPFLVRCGINRLTSQSVGIAQFLEQAAHHDGIFGDHLRRILILLTREPALADIMRGILQGTTNIDAGGFFRLRAAGVIKGDSPQEARPRCRLYADYLRQNLS